MSTKTKGSVKQQRTAKSPGTKKQPHKSAEKPKAEISNPTNAKSVEEAATLKESPQEQQEATTVDNQQIGEEVESPTPPPVVDPVLATAIGKYAEEIISPSTPVAEDSKTKKAEERAAHKAAVEQNKQRAREDREAKKAARTAAQAAKAQAKNALGERYHNACIRVSEIRRAFLHELDRKAEILGVVRIGEAVPNKTAESEELDTEIKNAREHLNTLLQRKRDMKGSSPELKEITQRLNQLRRERELARLEKKAAFEEAKAKAA